MDLQDTLIVVNGKKVKVADVLVYLKATGVFRDAVCRLVETEVVQDKAKDVGLDISENEFYEFASSKRRYARLLRAEDMQEYCRTNGITLDHWHSVAKSELLMMKMRAKVVQEKDILDYFTTHRDTMKTLSLSRIVCPDTAKAKDLKDRVSGGENFYDLARRYSLDEHTRAAGGYLGTVRRRMLSPKVEEVLFGARVDDVCGPFNENSLWSIYKVDAVREAELNNALKKEIADQLFKAWLARAIAASRFEKPK